MIVWPLPVRSCANHSLSYNGSSRPGAECAVIPMEGLADWTETGRLQEVGKPVEKRPTPGRHSEQPQPGGFGPVLPPCPRAEDAPTPCGSCGATQSDGCQHPSAKQSWRAGTAAGACWGPRRRSSSQWQPWNFCPKSTQSNRRRLRHSCICPLRFDRRAQKESTLSQHARLSAGPFPASASASASRIDCIAILRFPIRISTPALLVRAMIQ